MQELVQSLRLRWLGKQIGFPRLRLKTINLPAFPSNDSEYFQTESFGKALEFLKQNHSNCEMKEVKGKLIFASTISHSSRSHFTMSKNIRRVRISFAC